MIASCAPESSRMAIPARHARLEMAPPATITRCCDVVVVGAGPAGSASSALLSEAGHHVVLLDRSSFPRAKSCSEYTGPGTAAILERLGVADQLGRGLGRRLRGMELRAPNGDRHLLEYRARG